MPSLALGFRFRKGEGTGGKYRGIECACAFCSVLLQQSRGERSLRAANSTVTGPRKCKCHFYHSNLEAGSFHKIEYYPTVSQVRAGVTCLKAERELGQCFRFLLLASLATVAETSSIDS